MNVLVEQLLQLVRRVHRVGTHFLGIGVICVILVEALLVLPLYVPVLIFGVATASAAIVGPASPWPPLLMLCALSLASIVLAPIAASAALRTALR